MPRTEPTPGSGPQGIKPFTVGETLVDWLGFKYIVAIYNEDGSFAVDGTLNFGNGTTRYHYDANERHPYRRPQVS